MTINNNRQLKHLAERQRRVAEAMGLRDEILLIGAGEPIPLPEGSDQTYPFCAHPEYYYLTGIDSPGGVLAFDPRQRSSKGWVSFVPSVTEAEKMWRGEHNWSAHHFHDWSLGWEHAVGVRLSIWVRHCAGCDLMKAT